MQFPHICVLCNVNLLQDVCSWRVGVFLDVVNEASLYNQSHAEAKWDCRDSECPRYIFPVCHLLLAAI